MKQKGYKVAIKPYKTSRDISKTELYKIFKETNGVDYQPMIDELNKRTHLPKWICRLVYDREADILHDLGLLN